MEDETRTENAIMALISRAATDASFDVDKLAQLLDVRERWEAQEARKEYVAALAEFKRSAPRLTKNQRVDFSNKTGGKTQYSYAGLGQVANEIAASLAQHGLSHSWKVDQSESRVSVTCVLTHARGHSESVTISGPEDTTGNKNPIQQVGSAVTYLQRYTLLSITGLAAGDTDDDGRSVGRYHDAQDIPQTHQNPRPPPDSSENAGHSLPPAYLRLQQKLLEERIPPWQFLRVLDVRSWHDLALQMSPGQAYEKWLSATSGESPESLDDNIVEGGIVRNPTTSGVEVGTQEEIESQGETEEAGEKCANCGVGPRLKNSDFCLVCERSWYGADHTPE